MSVRAGSGLMAQYRRAGRSEHSSWVVQESVKCGVGELEVELELSHLLVVQLLRGAHARQHPQPTTTNTVIKHLLPASCDVSNDDTHQWSTFAFPSKFSGMRLRRAIVSESSFRSGYNYKHNECTCPCLLPLSKNYCLICGFFFGIRMYYNFEVQKWYQSKI